MGAVSTDCIPGNIAKLYLSLPGASMNIACESPIICVITPDAQQLATGCYILNARRKLFETFESAIWVKLRYWSKC